MLTARPNVRPTTKPISIFICSDMPRFPASTFESPFVTPHPPHLRASCQRKIRGGRSGVGIGTAPGQGRGEGGARVDPLEPVEKVRAIGAQSTAGAGGFEREAHHDVGGAELVAGEPVAAREL